MLHAYTVQIAWNSAEGTRDYRAYSRNHEIRVSGKPSLPASSDPTFRGDKTRYNPEEMLVASLSSCHLLWFLHLCADAGIVIVGYTDAAEGTMEETSSGGGRFREVTLSPAIVLPPGSDVSEELTARLNRLHERAHELCFIANSVNFPVCCVPQPIQVAVSDGANRA